MRREGRERRPAGDNQGRTGMVILARWRPAGLPWKWERIRHGSAGTCGDGARSDRGDPRKVRLTHGECVPTSKAIRQAAILPNNHSSSCLVVTSWSSLLFPSRLIQNAVAARAISRSNPTVSLCFAAIRRIGSSSPVFRDVILFHKAGLLLHLIECVYRILKRPRGTGLLIPSRIGAAIGAARLRRR